MRRVVAGYCPMGCGGTLYLDDDGNIKCGMGSCPRPDAAALILDDDQPNHIVVLGEDTFSVQHPLRERLDGQLFDCGLHDWLNGIAEPPYDPGRYVVHGYGPAWDEAMWEVL